jgi:hypothetical protein
VGERCFAGGAIQSGFGGEAGFGVAETSHDKLLCGVSVTFLVRVICSVVK